MAQEDLNLDELWEQLDENEKDNENIGGPSLTYWQDTFIRFKRNKTAMIGLITIILLVFIAILGPVFSKYSYYEQRLEFANLPPKLEILKISEDKYVYMHKNIKLYEVTEKGNFINLINPKKNDFIKKQSIYIIDGQMYTLDFSQKPMRLVNENNDVVDVYKTCRNGDYLLGTDSLGRDMLIRLIYGARISLLVAFIAALVNFFIGILYGGISGYLGGKVDNVMMRIVDIISVIPLTLYVVLIMVVLDSGLLSIIVALGSVYWVNMARIVRGEILSLKEQEFVQAAKTIGTSGWKILTKHLLPNAMGPIIVSMTMLIPQAIFTEAFLSFIGLGVSAPMASWGTLCNEALESIRTFPFQLLFPAVSICITMFAFNFLGDGLRDVLDPRLRK